MSQDKEPHKQSPIHPETLSITRNITALTSIWAASYFINQHIYCGFDLNILLTVLVFVAATFFTLLMPLKSKITFIHKNLQSAAIHFGMLILMFVSIAAYHGIRKFSPIIYSVSYVWEEGVKIEFRKIKLFLQQMLTFLNVLVLMENTT